jgi:hypothetical protein
MRPRPHHATARRSLLMATGLAALGACGDEPAAHPLAGLDGSYTAAAALAGELDLLERGHLVGMRFEARQPPVFRLVEMPLPTTFQPGRMVQGHFSTEGGRFVTFFSPDHLPIGEGEVERFGAELTLELRGNLGVTWLHLAPYQGLRRDQLAGAHRATRFTIRTADGRQHELVTAAGSVTLELGTAADRRYRLTLTPPPGVLDGEPIVYQGDFDTVGQALVLGQAFGCGAFIASAVRAGRLTFQGVACALQGERWLVEAEFEPG